MVFFVGFNEIWGKSHDIGVPQLKKIIAVPCKIERLLQAACAAVVYLQRGDPEIRGIDKGSDLVDSEL